jgi:SAM-dependent methyltransferase
MTLPRFSGAIDDKSVSFVAVERRADHSVRQRVLISQHVVVTAGDHWEGVWATRSTTEVSWYERDPTTSLRLIGALGPGVSAPIVDVGAGASSLVDCLLAEGFRDLTVVDVSARVLDEVRARLGQRAAAVTFVVHDVLTWEPDRRFDVWHDRAVFHFLVDITDQDRYVRLAAQAVRRGGAVVVAGFAEDGPPSCSGLPVCRHSASDLAATFKPFFTLMSHERGEHVTPAGIVQPFTWATLRRT